MPTCLHRRCHKAAQPHHSSEDGACTRELGALIALEIGRDGGQGGDAAVEGLQQRDLHSLKHFGALEGVAVKDVEDAEIHIGQFLQTTQR